MRYFLLLQLVILNCFSFKILQTGPLPVQKLVSQDPDLYTSKASWNSQSEKSLTKLKDEFIKSFFDIWNGDQEFPKLYDEANSQLDDTFKSCLAENYKYWDEHYLSATKQAQANKIFPQKNALTTRNTYLYLLPTEYPCFQDINQAGQGFPFDNNREDFLLVGTPVKIVSYSKDRVWACVMTNAKTYGWIKTLDLVVLSSEQSKKYVKDNNFSVTVKNKSVGTHENGKDSHVFYMGTVLPFLLKDNHENYLKVPVRQPEGSFTYSFYKVDKADSHTLPLPFTKENVIRILKQLNGIVYGWGSLNGNRDCSSLLRSYYAVFGINIPRNSKSQRDHAPKIINLEKMSFKEKLATIKSKGIPFLTTIYLPGHVMMYVGNDEKLGPIYFHSIWGVKTKRDGIEGRYIIGKSLFTNGEIYKGLEEYSAIEKSLTDKATMLMSYSLE